MIMKVYNKYKCRHLMNLRVRFSPVSSRFTVIFENELEGRIVYLNLCLQSQSKASLSSILYIRIL